jgi:hypothetical protein
MQNNNLGNGSNVLEGNFDAAWGYRGKVERARAGYDRRYNWLWQGLGYVRQSNV